MAGVISTCVNEDSAKVSKKNWNVRGCRFVVATIAIDSLPASLASLRRVLIIATRATMRSGSYTQSATSMTSKFPNSSKFGFSQSSSFEQARGV